ncbi:MAG: hypothetical protein KDA78_04290 [Planctomycetaceae bacterium]|nr:hypothetical protein [Planctomycetaceae bacterium]
MSHEIDSLIVSPEFYFLAEASLCRDDQFEKRVRSGKCPPLPESFRLPDLFIRSLEEPAGQSVLACWSEQGLGIQFQLEAPAPADSAGLKKASVLDRIQLFIDTRDLKSNHRLTRFCAVFEIVPPNRFLGKQNAKISLNESSHHHQQLETGTIEIPFASSLNKQGYLLSIFIPREVLTGFSPAEVPSLGFYYLWNDCQLGMISFGPRPEFPVASDPSLWPSLKLIS